MARAPHGVPKAQRLLLTHKPDRAGRRQHLQKALQFRCFFPRAELGFQFIGVIEVIGNDVLAAPGDKYELLDSGFLCFLDRVLDNRLVYDRKHFLGYGFGGGQEACA